jgi:sugar lactone lactonase YvrE
MEVHVTTETLTAEPFLSGLFFGECPRWHESRLWYSDFFDHTVFSASPDGERRVEVPFDGEPAGLGWLPDGRLLIASRLDRAIMRREPDGTLVRHGDLRPWATWHANDMVVASNGQAYAGNFGFDLDSLYAGTLDASQIGPTSLIRVDPDGSTHQAADELAFPNGTVITEDGGTLVIAESMGGRLTAFDRQADGTLVNRREWAVLPGIAPDGICLCEDDTIWVANAFASECVRVAEGGEVLERVATSVNCFACMLGDEDRRTLYMVTAPDSHDAKARADRRGAIEKVRTTVPGAGLP